MDGFSVLDNRRQMVTLFSIISVVGNSYPRVALFSNNLTRVAFPGAGPRVGEIWLLSDV